MQKPTGLKQVIGKLLPDGSEEEGHRARILMVAGLVLAIAGTLISVVQVILWVHPAFPPAPGIDLAADALAVLTGAVVVWLVRSGRIRLAAWVLLGCLWAVASVHLYLEGRPPTDVAGGLGIFLVIALAFVLLDRRSAWLVCLPCAVSSVAIHILWLGGHLPQPVTREPSTQAAFSILGWLATAGIIVAVVSSTMGALRKHHEHLEEMVDEGTRELRGAQQRLAEVLELNQGIIKAASLGITAYQTSGQCVLANESASHIIGATREDLLQQNFYHIGSWKASSLLAAAKEALSSGSETHKEVHVVSTFGKDIWIDCRFVPFFSSGEPHLLVLIDDVTEQRELQERLVRSERLAVLGQLAGGVGHDLRNPLGAIKNAAYFLNMVLDEPDPEVRETLDILEKEVGTSERIISGLLGFARPEPPMRRRMAVNDVVQEALSGTRLPPSIAVVSRLGEDLPTSMGDADQLRQVFDNLIRNAIQAMPQGGRLTVRTEVQSPEWLAVSIADTGVGIPEGNLERIFEPLFTTRAKGIGLGLAIAKTLVEGHGGSIEAESQVGEGTTFTVKLPLGRGSSGERVAG